MRIRFQNTLEDLQAEQKVLRHLYRQTSESPQTNRLGLFVILGGLVGLFFLGRPLGDGLLLVAPVVAAVVFIVGLVKLGERMFIQQRYHECVAGYPTEIDLYPNGIEWSAGGVQTFTPAGDLGEIVSASNRLLVFWKHSSPQRPHALLNIPQDAFASDEEFDAFRKSVEDLRETPEHLDGTPLATDEAGVCTLTTCHTIEELAQALRYSAELCPPPRRSTLAVGGWCLLFVVIGLVLLVASPNRLGQVLSGLLTLLPPLVFWKLRQARGKMTAEQLEAVWPREHLENPYRWTITPAGLRSALLQGWTLLPWDRIRTWAETDIGLVIVQAGDMVLFVPRRAAPSTDEWTEFVNTFRRWAPDARPA